MDDGGWGSIRVLEFSAWVLTATAKLQNQDKTHSFEKNSQKISPAAGLSPSTTEAVNSAARVVGSRIVKKNYFFSARILFMMMVLLMVSGVLCEL